MYFSQAYSCGLYQRRKLELTFEEREKVNSFLKKLANLMNGIVRRRRRIKRIAIKNKTNPEKKQIKMISSITGRKKSDKLPRIKKRKRRKTKKKDQKRRKKRKRSSTKK